MEKQITVWISSVLLLASLNFSQAQRIPEYFEDGGTITLGPTVSETIGSIVWKFNGNLVAEWVKDAIELDYYDKYKGRTTLNTATGQLVITKMQKDDVGSYTVEINNKVHSQSYDVKWITRVPKPTAVFRPLTCGPDSESCSVTCEGKEAASLSDAEPIQYSWKIGDKAWETKTMEVTITRDQTQKESIKTISCRMENRVSQEDSGLTVNPMYTEPSPSSSPTAGIIIGVLLAAAAAVGFGVWKFRPDLLPGCMTKCGGGNDIEAMGVKNISTGAEPNNSPGAEPNGSPGAEPDKSTGPEPNNSTGPEPNNSTGPEPNDSELDPKDPELQPLKSAVSPPPDN